MRRPPLHRLVSFAAILVLLAATTAYLSHFHSDPAQSDHAAHCSLCLQLNGTAGAPGTPALIVKAVVAERLPVTRQAQVSFVRPPISAHRSRAPPLAFAS